MQEKFYVTTPIYYVNSVPHLGHVYTTLVADALVRFKRQRGQDVYFQTGTDEHGDKIERAAEKAGLPPKEHVDKIVAQFVRVFGEFGFKYDHFIRTTDDYHEKGVQELWTRARDAGYIYKGQYEGWFCHNDQEFVNVEAVDDKPPICPNPWCQRPTERIAEESYFFKLSEFQDRLLDLYETQPAFIQPDIRRNEVISFVKSGLKDLSVSRVSVKWGIPVPDDPKHTMYVWFDALTNYWTGVTKRGAEENLARFWPANLHLVGKDILRFHTIYWPAFLMAAGIPLPKQVYAHGHWLSGGRKMSKTLGNVIGINVLIRHFKRDWVRYFCLREMVFGLDGDFTYQALIDRVNSDLANGLGNLGSRVLTMIRNYFGGVIPARTEIGATEAEELTGGISTLTERFNGEFQALNFSRALESVWEYIKQVDTYITSNAPWNLAKDPAKRPLLETVLNASVTALHAVIVLLSPVLPDSTALISKQIGLTEGAEKADLATLGEAKLAGITIGEVAPVFPRIDKDKTMSEINEETKESAPAEPVASAPEPVAAPATTSPAPEPPTEGDKIEITDFAKVDLRVGLVLEAARLPKSDKLLVLKIDLGEAQPRQILAGMAQYYTPEQMVGRKVVVVANLKPRKMRGLESQGMVVAASIGDEGKPVLAGFLEDVPVGAKLR